MAFQISPSQIILAGMLPPVYIYISYMTKLLDSCSPDLHLGYRSLAGTSPNNAPPLGLQGLSRIRKTETHTLPPTESNLIFPRSVNALRLPRSLDNCRGYSFRHPKTSLYEIYLEGLLLFLPRHPLHTGLLQSSDKDRQCHWFSWSKCLANIGQCDQVYSLGVIFLVAKYRLCESMVFRP